MFGQAMMLGGHGKLVDIFDTSVADFEMPPTDAFAGYRLEPDGDIRKLFGQTNQLIGDWLLQGTADLYEARCTELVGFVTPAFSDSVGVWLSLASVRQWQKVASAGNHQATIFVEIRHAASGLILDSATIMLEAESTP